MTRAPAALWGVVLAKLVGHAATIGLYGFHRDEIYLMASGQRAAWGSPDHGPATPALSWLTTRFIGGSPAAQRAPDVIAGALVVWLTGLSARRMGGDARAELLAAGAALIAPVFLYMGGVHSTNGLDQLAVALASYLLVTILRAPEGESRRGWIAVGAATGVGLLNKYSIGLFIAAALFAFVATPARAHLRGRWPWIAAVIAAAIVSPNIAWQWAHGAPALDFLRETHAAIQERHSPVSLLVDQARLLGPIPLSLAALGAARGLRRGAPLDARFFACFGACALALLVLAGGKPYYLAPAYPPLFAVGAVALSPRLGSWGARFAAAAFALSGVIGALGALPLLPAKTSSRLGLRALNSELVEFADYRRLVQHLALIHAKEARGEVVGLLTASYGLAAAIERYGPDLGLPRPISGANSYFVWSDVEAPPDVFLAHAYEPLLLRRAFVVVRPVGELTLDGASRFDFPRIIYRCEGPVAPMKEQWRLFRRYD